MDAVTSKAREATQEYLIKVKYPQCPNCGSVFLTSRRVDEIGLELEIYCEDCSHICGRQPNSYRLNG